MPVALSAVFWFALAGLAAQAETPEWEGLNERGLQAVKDNDLEGAESIFKQAEEKLVAGGHQDADLATVKHHMAEIYEKQGKYQEAEAYYKEAIQLRQENLGDDHLLTARSMVNLARMYEKERKFDNAAEEYNKAGAIIDKSMGAQFPGVRAPADLVNWVTEAEKAEKVPAHATLGADKLEQRHGANHPEAANQLNNLGDFYRAHGKFDQAEEMYKRSADIDPIKEPNDPAAAQRYADLAAMYQHKGRLEEAEQYFEKAQAALESSEATLDKRGTTYNKMAHFYEAKGDNEKAEKYYKEALDAREQFSDDKKFSDNRNADKPVAETLSDYAKFLHKVGKNEAADKMDDRAHDILESLKQ